MDLHVDFSQVDFEEFFNLCEVERLAQIGSRFQESKIYIELTGRSDEVYDKIQAALPKRMRDLMCRYEDIMIEQITEVEQIFYRQGMADAAKLIYGLLGKKL